MENTIADGFQVVKNELFKRNYTEFFPTAYLSYAASEKSQWGLSIGRRIQRPNYMDMNPFQRILDQFTYQEGNPYLKPQFSKNLGLSVSFNKQLLKWWTTSIFLNVYYNEFEGIVNNANLKADMAAGMLNISHQFRFNKGWGQK